MLNNLTAAKIHVQLQSGNVGNPCVKLEVNLLGVGKEGALNKNRVLVDSCQLNKIERRQP